MVRDDADAMVAVSWVGPNVSVYRAVATGTTATAGNVTATITPALKDLFVVFAFAAGTGVGATLTDNNTNLGDVGAYTLAQSVTFGGSKLHAYVRNSLLRGTTSTIVTFDPGASSTAAALAVIAIGSQNVAMPAAQLQGQTATGAAGVATVTLPTSSQTEDLTLIALANTTNPPGLTAPAGWTNRSNIGAAGPIGLIAATRDSGFTGTAITWGTNPVTTWGSIALEISALAMDSVAAPVLTASAADLGLSSGSAVVEEGTGVIHRMRARDSTLGALVFWSSPTVDMAGDRYTGPGPLTDVVVQKVIPS